MCFSRFLRSVSATHNVDDQDMEIAADTLTYFRSPNYPDTATPVDAEATCHFTATSSTFQMSVFNSTSFLDDGNTDDYELEVTEISRSGSSITRRLMVTGSTRGKPQRLNYPEFVGVDLTGVTLTYARGQRNLRFLLRIEGRCFVPCDWNMERVQESVNIVSNNDLWKQLSW